MPDLYLGIDTSNYKTSVAVVDSENCTIFEKSEYLEVPKGSRGLRQSEAFFRHSNRLPSYIEEICRAVDPADIRAAGVSTRPRRVEGSYMPCFLAGTNAAREITSVLNIPLHEFSHQEGHAAAVIENSPYESYRDTTALFHLSGGTTELLICRPDDSGYSLEIAGGTQDISIGQLIDRAGVAMGYPFPAGAYLDKMAQEYFESHGRVRSSLPKVRLTDGSFNLSGIETKVLRMIESSQSDDFAEISYSIFETVAAMLTESALYAEQVLRDADPESGLTPRVIMAGGVSASTFIRQSVANKLSHKNDPPAVVFGEPSLSGDNAVGIARLARRISQNSI